MRSAPRRSPDALDVGASLTPVNATANASADDGCRSGPFFKSFEETAMTRRTPVPTPQTPPGHLQRYRDRIFDDKRHDPYEPPGKYAEPTRCPKCGAVYARGRWRSGGAPPRSHTALCPACRRTQEKLPAGVLTLEGPFVAEHKDALIRIARNEASHESAEHPMHRIMSIDERNGRIEISTTDIHLPQRIGEALERAHRGDLAIRYASDEYNVRVRWHR
jgi:hypothetical protein